MLVRIRFMKSISKALVTALMVSNFSINFAAAQAVFGHRGGNGGNSVAYHFTTIARNIQMVWEDICTNEKDPEAFCNYRNDYAGLLDIDNKSYVTVRGEKDPNKVKAYDGQIREAINYTDPNEIVINEQAWKDMETDPKVYSKRIGLVMHEYITFIGLDSSDHYDFSAAIFGMLVRKGYDLNKLTRIEGLPSPCSLSISGHFETETHQDFKKTLIKKGYLVKSPTEQTRYKLNLYAKCADKTASSSCALHAQVTDNYTASISFDEMAIDSAVFAKRSTIFKRLTDKILAKIPNRSCKNMAN